VKTEDDFVYNNEDESDMGALHSIHVHLNAIAVVRRSITTGPSALFCVDCSEQIEEGRRLAVQGCKRCLGCQEAFER
jgi:phage/conjugal plasmid C-4 type zinc finger TraR family protein